MAAATERTDNMARCLHTYRYLSQDEVWLPNGKPAVRISDMDKEWRYNAARWLERRVAWFEMAYSLGEAVYLAQPQYTEVIGHVDGEDILGQSFSALDLMSDHVQDMFDRDAQQRATDPVAWLRETPLYRGLVADLPKSTAQLDAIAARAKHYAGCPQREQTGADCDCNHLAAVVENEREIANGTPEWTDD